MHNSLSEKTVRFFQSRVKRFSLFKYYVADKTKGTLCFEIHLAFKRNRQQHSILEKGIRKYI